jgi:hypothetical protein
VNAPWSRHVALIATIAALIGAGCTAGAPTASPIGSAAPTAAEATQPSPSVVPAASAEASQRVESPSADPSAVTVSDPPDTIDGTAGPGCGTGRAGLSAHNDEVPAVLHFGGATIEFTTAEIELRNGTYVADDAIPAGLGLSPKETAVVVGPADHIILRGTGLVLEKLQVAAVPWSDVSFDGGLASWTVTPSAVAWHVRGDGSLSVTAPDAVGDFAIEFIPLWHSPCLRGDGTAYSRIKVR